MVFKESEHDNVEQSFHDWADNTVIKIASMHVEITSEDELIIVVLYDLK